jgi:uncharacterized protein with PIN domain
VLETVLEDSTIPFISIIAFSTRADLRLEQMTTEVIYSTRLLSTINKYKTELLSEEQKNQIYKALSGTTIHSKDDRKKHVSEIKSKLNNTRVKVNSGICPKCNGHLVERRGKNGTFTGCNNYPRCRFTSI